MILTTETIEKIKEKCKRFREENPQSYIYIEFEASTFDWGTISFRKDLSGAQNGETEFMNSEELMRQLDWICEKL